MCGRFTLALDLSDLQFEFPLDADYAEAVAEHYGPGYNIAPTNEVLTYGAQGDRSAEFMRWGLVPFWAKDTKVGSKMINARAETVATSNAFRNALRKRRCLIIADSFYEWKRTDGTKTPMRIGLKGWRPFGFAGLWESWTDKDTGQDLHSCTIITTTPNEMLEPIHDRMPVILPQEVHHLWLDQNIEDATRLTTLLQPYPSDEMEAYAVSDTVNSVKNKGPECILAA